MCRTQADIKTARFERGELSQEQQTFLKVYSFNKEFKISLAISVLVIIIVLSFNKNYILG